MQKHPAIVEAAVVAEPDAEIGNKIRAVVVLSEGQTATDELNHLIRDSLRSQLAPHKIELAKSLPQSAVDRILRTALARAKPQS